MGVGKGQQARSLWNRRMMLLGLGVLATALSCEVSVGYATPILGLGTVGFEHYAALSRIIADKVLPTGRPFAVLQDYPGIH